MKTSLLLLSLCGIFTANAQTPADTLADVRHPNRVLVVRNDSTVNIRVKGAENDNNYFFNYTLPHQGNTSFVEEAGKRWDFTLPKLFGQKPRHRKQKNRKIEWLIPLRFGFHNLTDAQGDIRTQFGSTFEIEAGFVSLAFTYGNFDGERISIGDYPAGSKVGRSVFRLNRHVIPALYRYTLNRKWSFTAGAMLQLNVRPRLYNTYYISNKEVVDTYKKNLPIRPVTTALYGSVSYDQLGFYVRYQPTSVFTKDFGPQFNTLTAGLCYGF